MSSLCDADVHHSLQRRQTALSTRATWRRAREDRDQAKRAMQTQEMATQSISSS